MTAFMIFCMVISMWQGILITGAMFGRVSDVNTYHIMWFSMATVLWLSIYNGVI